MQRHGLRHRPWVPSRWGSPERSAPTGDVEANYTSTGLDGPPGTWSCGASDHDGSANAASHVEIHFYLFIYPFPHHPGPDDGEGPRNGCCSDCRSSGGGTVCTHE